MSFFQMLAAIQAAQGGWDYIDLAPQAGRPKSKNGSGRRTGVAAAKRAAKKARRARR